MPWRWQYRKKRRLSIKYNTIWNEMLPILKYPVSIGSRFCLVKLEKIDFISWKPMFQEADCLCWQTEVKLRDLVYENDILCCCHFIVGIQFHTKTLDVKNNPMSHVGPMWLTQLAFKYVQEMNQKRNPTNFKYKEVGLALHIWIFINQVRVTWFAHKTRFLCLDICVTCEIV